MPLNILEANESEAVLSLDLSQIDLSATFEIRNNALKPASKIHLQISDVASTNSNLKLKARLTGSSAELIIHNNNLPSIVDIRNFAGFKSVKEEVYDDVKIRQIKDFLKPYVIDSNSKLPDFTVLENFLPNPKLYPFSLMIVQHALKNHNIMPTGIMIEAMINYLAKNPDTKEALITSNILSLLKLSSNHLKHLDLVKLAKAMDITQNTRVGDFTAKALWNALEKEFKPNKELKAILERIIDGGEDATKTKNCKLLLTKIAKEEQLETSNLESLKAKSNNLELDSEDLKAETKDLSALLQEMAESNNYNRSSIDQLHSAFSKVTDIYLHDSNFAPQSLSIKDWNKDNIKSFAKKIKEDLNLGAKDTNNNLIFEIIAVIKRANLIFSGHTLRDVQILSLLSFVSTQNHGKLLQISTGEGKSTITASLGIIKALQGYRVDIITSSPVLAKRDALEKSGFFSLFGLTIGHNCDNEGYREGLKDCYSKDIVYGDISSFQYDMLRHFHLNKGTKGDRKFDLAIVDEVDSMLIDENSKIAMLSNHTPASEYLEPLFGIILNEITRFNRQVVYSAEHNSTVYVNGLFEYDEHDHSITLKNDNAQIFSNIVNMAKFRHEHIKSYITNIITNELVPIPLHLKTFALNQVDVWIKSCLKALNLIEKKDYLILKDDKGTESVAPIDYQNTGLVHAKTVWTDGLHQFLQIKHGLKITSENLITSFISNLSYLLLYKKNIYGMTGTLGSIDAREMLKNIYDVELAFIPNHKPKRFEEVPALLAEDNLKWLNYVTESAISISANNRASLIICESIKNVELIKESLISRGFPNNLIKVYSRNDNKESEAVDNVVNCREIIIATNLAGRGTDLKTTRALEEKGGLHVCVAFLPPNLRVEEQAFGRTARQGNFGSAQLIINTVSANEMLHISSRDNIDSLSIDDYKAIRDLKEHEKLQSIMLYDKDRIILEDLLFSKYSKLMHELKKAQDSKSKLAQVEENWGIFFKNIKSDIAAKTKTAIELNKQDSANQLNKKNGQGLNSNSAESFGKEISEFANQSFEQFASNVKDQYGQNYNIVLNPAYLVLEGFNNMPTGRYAESLKLFLSAAKLDSNFSNPSYYNAAYAAIRGKVGNYKQEAYNYLTFAKNDIEQVLIPNLELMQVTAVQDSGSQLAKQIISKIELLKLQLKYINQTQSKISNCQTENEIEISESKLLKDFFESNNSMDSEILELNLYGIHNLFDVKEIEVPVDNFAALFMAVASVVQIGVGLTLAASGNVAIGASLIIEGLQDSIKAIEMSEGKKIDFSNYFTNKGISLAVTVIASGAENLITKLGTATATGKGGLELAAKEALKEAAKESAKTVVLSEAAKKLANQELVKVVFKEVVKKVVVNTAIDKIANHAASSILAEFKEEIRSNVEDKINECLNAPHAASELNSLFEIDSFNSDSENFNKVLRSGLGTLERKQNILGYLVKSVVGQLASSASANAYIKAAASLMQVAEIAKAMHDVTTLTSELQDKLKSTVKDLSQKPNDIASLLKTKISSLNVKDANEIVLILESKGYACNNRMIKIDNIEQVDFKDNNYLREYIIRHLKKLYEAQSKDHGYLKQKLTSELTNYVSKSLMTTIRSEIMLPASSSPLAKLSQMVTDGIAKTAAEFANIVRSEKEAALNANHAREEGRSLGHGIQSQQQELGVGAGDEIEDQYKGSSSQGGRENKGGKETNKTKPAGNRNNGNNDLGNNNEWVNPDETLSILMKDPRKLEQLRKQREDTERTHKEGINPETAQYLKSVFSNMQGSNAAASNSIAALAVSKATGFEATRTKLAGSGESSEAKGGLVQGREKQSLPEMGAKAFIEGALSNLDIAKPIAVSMLTDEMFTANSLGIGDRTGENVAIINNQIRQVENALLPSEAVKHIIKTHTGIDIIPKPETVGGRTVVGALSAAGSFAALGGGAGIAARTAVGAAIGGTSSLLQETGMHPIAAEAGAITSTALAFKGGVSALRAFESHFVKESVPELAHKFTAAEVASTDLSKIEHKLLLDKPFDFPVTNAVEIPVGGNIKPTMLGKYYEEAVCKQFEISKPKNYRTSIDGKKIQGKADHVIEEEGKKIAIDAKYVDDWAGSIRNPVYTNNKPWLVEGGEKEMIKQARKYSSHFYEFRYHTNSLELAEHYTRVFNSEGIKNFKFIITPVVKK